MHTSSTRVGVTTCLVTIALTTSGAWLTGRPHADVQAPAVSRNPARQLISALDDCIQERFKDVDKGFGFRRIVKAGDTAHRFKPESVRETDAVRDLESAHLRVVLYLVGRRVLGSSEEIGPRPDMTARQVIKGPVLVTSTGDQDTQAPLPTSLWEESRRAMLAFAGGDAHDFTVKDWTFDARPVRASDAECLRCHVRSGIVMRPTTPASSESLRLGDPLGAVIYGYRHSREDRELHR